MAAENSSASTVPAGSSGLGSLIQLADLLGGQRQTVSSSANIAPLQQVLGNLQSQDYSAQLASILQSVAGQTPGLAARYSNAVGARSGSNAPLAANLDKLITDAALKGQMQIGQLQGQNQATQAQVAQAIAQATRGTQTQSGTNLGRAATGLGVLKLGEDFTKSDLGKRAVSGAGNMFDSLSNYFNSDSAADSGGGVINNYIDSVTGSGWQQELANAGQLFDANTLFSGGDATAYDTQDVVDLWDSIGLADGGLVGRDGNSRSVRSAGGRKSSAPTYEVNPVTKSAASAVSSTAGGIGIAGTAGGTAAEAAPPGSISPGQALSIALSTITGNVPGMIATVADMAMSQNQGKNVSIAAPAAVALSNTNPVAQALALGKAILGLLGLGTGSNSTTEGPGSGVSSVGPGFGGNSIAGVSLADNSSAALGPMSIAPGMNSSISGLTGDASTGVSSSSVGDSGSSSGSGLGDGGFGGAGPSSPGGMKSGGEVKGPGTGTSDSIRAKLSDGEYVIPADVVQRLGVGFFDGLRAQFHTPIKG